MPLLWQAKDARQERQMRQLLPVRNDSRLPEGKSQETEVNPHEPAKQTTPRILQLVRGAVSHDGREAGHMQRRPLKQAQGLAPEVRQPERGQAAKLIYGVDECESRKPTPSAMPEVRKGEQDRSRLCPVLP